MIGHAERLADGRIVVSGGTEGQARRAAMRIAEGSVHFIEARAGSALTHHPIRFYSDSPKPTSHDTNRSGE